MSVLEYVIEQPEEAGAARIKKDKPEKGGEKVEVNSIPTSSVLRLELQIGVSSGGNPVLRRRNLVNVKSTANDQDLFDIATAVGSLQKYPLYGIARVDTAQLIQS